MAVELHVVGRDVVPRTPARTVSQDFAAVGEKFIPLDFDKQTQAAT